MDDKVFQLAVASLVLAGVGLLLDAPNEFYIFLGAVYAFLGTVAAAAQRRRNGRNGQ